MSWRKSRCLRDSWGGHLAADWPARDWADPGHLSACCYVGLSNDQLNQCGQAVVFKGSLILVKQDCLVVPRNFVTSDKCQQFLILSLFFWFGWLVSLYTGMHGMLWQCLAKEGDWTETDGHGVEHVIIPFSCFKSLDTTNLSKNPDTAVCILSHYWVFILRHAVTMETFLDAISLSPESVLSFSVTLNSGSLRGKSKLCIKIQTEVSLYKISAILSLSDWADCVLWFNCTDTKDRGTVTFFSVVFCSAFIVEWSGLYMM